MYWSLKTKIEEGSEGLKVVSKTTSLEERRVTVKPNGAVSWRVKMRSFWEMDACGVWRGRRSCGISHLWLFESVIRILSLSLVS